MNVTSIGIDVKLHLFEFTTMLVNYKGRAFNCPMQMVFGMKEKNAGKLDSHQWFFKAFCEQCRPKYCVLLDVGTLPTETAVYRLIRAMENNAELAGVCGEIAVEQPFAAITNFVVSSQNFEYKVSNMMDKALESVLGFITVLPGAFSAYRWEAIEGRPLEAYFKSLGRSTFELGAFKGNMYLAEDRILCFELVAKAGSKWQMKYVKEALARTDVPEDAIALMLQRRRWLNGSLFATLYALLNVGRVFMDTTHSWPQKLFLGLNFAYMAFNTLLSFFLIGNFFLVTEFLLGDVDLNSSIPDDISWMRPVLDEIFQVTLLLYKGTVVTLFLAALVVKPKEFALLYNCICAFLGFVAVNVLCIAVSSIETGNVLASYIGPIPVWYLAAMIFLIFFIVAIFHGELRYICISFVQYFVMLSYFVHMQIYAFCNLHDLSWGTKGLEASSSHGGAGGTAKPSRAGNRSYLDVLEMKARRDAELKHLKTEGDNTTALLNRFRFNVLFVWVGCNAALYIVVQAYVPADYFISALLVIGAAINGIRLLGWVVVVDDREPYRPLALADEDRD